MKNLFTAVELILVFYLISLVINIIYNRITADNNELFDKHQSPSVHVIAFNMLADVQNKFTACFHYKTDNWRR